MFDSNFYERNLPHWQPLNTEYFVTFRLAGTLPKFLVEELSNLREQWQSSDRFNHKISERDSIAKRLFAKYEQLLDAAEMGPVWLSNPNVAAIVEEAIRYRDEKYYDLYAYCIMSNHVHLVFKLNDGAEFKTEFPVTEIFKNLKSYTALQANRLLNRSGAFWQSESFDRVIRDQNELGKTIKYVLNNPVKAGLVNEWNEWKFTYCKDEFLD